MLPIFKTLMYAIVNTRMAKHQTMGYCVDPTAEISLEMGTVPHIKNVLVEPKMIGERIGLQRTKKEIFANQVIN